MKNIRNIFFMPRVKRQFEKAKVAHPELGNHINDLRNEIGYYLAAHKAAGIRFDSRHLEIIYSDGVTVVLRQTLGIWIITRIVLTLPDPSCEGIPAGLWLQARQGRGPRSGQARVFALAVRV